MFQPIDMWPMKTRWPAAAPSSAGVTIWAAASGDGSGSRGPQKRTSTTAPTARTTAAPSSTRPTARARVPLRSLSTRPR